MKTAMMTAQVRSAGVPMGRSAACRRSRERALLHPARATAWSVAQ
jgi:hypothetical protein